jgi:hypothetical protein
LRERLESGIPVTIFESLYLAVDSVIDGVRMADDLELRELRRRGLEGWEVVGVIPRTAGVALNNQDMSGMLKSYGGGMGGNVVGVHVLLRRAVTSGDLSTPTALVRRHIALSE